MNKINWKELASDDFVAEEQLFGIKYTFRIEQMDKKSWWACIYENDNYLCYFFDNHSMETLNQAKKAVSEEFKHHLNKIKKEIEEYLK